MKVVLPVLCGRRKGNGKVTAPPGTASLELIDAEKTKIP